MVGLQLNVSVFAIKHYAIYVRILEFQSRSQPVFANNRYAIYQVQYRMTQPIFANNRYATYQVQYRMTCKSVAILAQIFWPKKFCSSILLFKGTVFA